LANNRLGSKTEIKNKNEKKLENGHHNHINHQAVHEKFSVDDGEEYVEEDLVDRVERLEGGISEIKDMITQMMITFNSKKYQMGVPYV
jgi:hypothetical protein